MIERVEKRVAKETAIKPEGYLSFFEMITPAFVGGAVIGLFIGLPGVNLFLPIVLFGGQIAVRLASEYYEKSISEKDAAKLGAFAGLMGAFIGAIILFVVAVFYANNTFDFFKRFMDPRTAETILVLSGLDPYVSLLTLRIRFLFNLIACTALGAAGAVIYVRQLKGK